MLLCYYYRHNDKFGCTTFGKVAPNKEQRQVLFVIICYYNKTTDKFFLFPIVYFHRYYTYFPAKQGFLLDIFAKVLYTVPSFKWLQKLQSPFFPE